MGLNWEDIQNICGRYEGKILQVVTIVLDTVANENATISIAAIIFILLSENLTFHWSTQATELPTARNFHNFLRPKCVIKLCVAIVCDYMETTFSAIVCVLRSAIRDRLRSFAIIWKPGLSDGVTVRIGVLLPTLSVWFSLDRIALRFWLRLRR